MTYFNWNEHIAKYFFKPENAGKDILFYLTKQDLIKYSRQNFYKSTDEEIWNDFIHGIKFGEQNVSEIIPAYSPVARSLQLYSNWNKTDIPPFIGYLILYIIPLTETYVEDFRANNYYGKVTEFFKRNSIIGQDEKIYIGNFQTISHLWNALEEWSIITKNCDLGIFELKKFGNPHWIYVGKPFSQCVLPPRSINKLPELFYEAELIPDLTYSKEEFKKILLQYGAKILSVKGSVIDLIKKSDSNELGLSIIETVIREYYKWTGEAHEREEDGSLQKIKRSYTVAPLFLQFKLNQNDGIIFFSFRMYSSNEYPEDLKFGDYENLYETGGWSKTLNLEFKESFQLKDDFNKWIARFPEKDVRLFVSAGTYQLSTDYWIETEWLSKTDSMFLLCKDSKRESIVEWGKTFLIGNFKQEDLEGLPEGYAVFKIFNPLQSHPTIPLLTLYTEKKIHLKDGLKLNFRTFINDFLPEVEITNSTGNEKIILQFRDSTNKKFLIKNQSNSNRWQLPADIILNSEFNINIADENCAGNEIPFSIISSNDSSKKIDGIQLPKRDKFGRQIAGDAAQYCLGSNIISPMKNSQRYYCPLASLFTSNKEDKFEENIIPPYFKHAGNMLSGFLSTKSVLTTEEFYNGFEFYFSKQFHNRKFEYNFNLARTKRSSLNFYDYIGYLDYDYEEKKVVVNPPQLIFIPVSKGRKALLIGGRDESFVKSIINSSLKNNLEVEIRKQFTSNEFLLLPDIITIKSFGNQKEGYGEKNLISLSKELDIKFSNDYFPQVALQDFSASIEEYTNSILLTDENDYGWARKIFNPETLKYEKSETHSFDKSFSLIEYKLNEYTYYNKLWLNEKCFKVDKNWGRYAALKYFNKHVILFDSSRKRVAIPWETPLPRLLAESIMLLSGYAPDFLEIRGRYYRVYENIPGILTENLFRKLGQRPINCELK